MLIIMQNPHNYLDLELKQADRSQKVCVFNCAVKDVL